MSSHTPIFFQSPPAIDFVVSWLAATHTFWSPVIYWMLNDQFRRASHRFFIRRVRMNDGN